MESLIEAQKAQGNMDELEANMEDNEAMPRTTFNMNNRATLLILDRTFDLAGPLMHEYSYWNFI